MCRLCLDFPLPQGASGRNSELVLEARKAEVKSPYNDVVSLQRILPRSAGHRFDLKTSVLNLLPIMSLPFTVLCLASVSETGLPKSSSFITGVRLSFILISCFHVRAAGPSFD